MSTSNQHVLPFHKSTHSSPNNQPNSYQQRAHSYQQQQQQQQAAPVSTTVQAFTPATTTGQKLSTVLFFTSKALAVLEVGFLVLGVANFNTIVPSLRRSDCHQAANAVVALIAGVLLGMVLQTVYIIRNWTDAVKRCGYVHGMWGVRFFFWTHYDFLFDKRETFYSILTYYAIDMMAHIHSIVVDVLIIGALKNRVEQQTCYQILEDSLPSVYSGLGLGMNIASFSMTLAALFF
jgi:hypothetical protein